MQLSLFWNRSHGFFIVLHVMSRPIGQSDPVTTSRAAGSLLGDLDFLAATGATWWNSPARS